MIRKTNEIADLKHTLFKLVRKTNLTQRLQENLTEKLSRWLENALPENQNEKQLIDRLHQLILDFYQENYQEILKELDHTTAMETPRKKVVAASVFWEKNQKY